MEYVNLITRKEQKNHVMKMKLKIQGGLFYESSTH